jgi:thymidylate kinase
MKHILIIVDGTDRTGKDRICSKLCSDFPEILWINGRQTVTPAYTNFAIMLRDNINRKFNIANCIELNAITAALEQNQEQQKIILTNRSYLSSIIYAKSTIDRYAAINIGQTAHARMLEVFDIIMITLTHDNIESVIDVETDLSWVKAESDLHNINEKYKTLLNTYKSNCTALDYIVSDDYTNSDQIYSDIVKCIKQHKA